MPSIPSNLSRVPNMLASQIMLSSIQSTSKQLVESQLQLVSGLRVERPSDDAIASSTISVLDGMVERRDQRLRNLSHAESMLGNLDAALSDANELLLEAKSIGASQIGIGSDETTRLNQAKVIDSTLDSLVSVANREVMGLHLFAGEQVRDAPFRGIGTGIAYGGKGEGLITDLGISTGTPITMAGTTAFGALSARVRGDRDLDPVMSDATPVEELRGAFGKGVNLGSITVNINGADNTLDLTEAFTVGDVRSSLEALLQTVDGGASVAIDAASGSRFSITLSAGTTVTISDPGTTTATAGDLGLEGVYGAGTSSTAADLDPVVSEQTAVASLRDSGGSSLNLGVLRIRNGDQVRDVDLSAAGTIQDVMNAVDGLDIGVRVVIGDDGRRIDFLNEVSGVNLSVSEVSGGDTATQLGVRTLAGATELAAFNDGLGVQILDDYYDPVTGLRDATKDLDFRITTKDGTELNIDLAGALTVQDVLDRINAQASAEGVAGQVSAGLAGDGNGIQITDTTFGFSTVVESLNGSTSAEDLGIAGSTGGATLIGEDRATVAVDSVFSHLISLRDALEANDQSGITLATERLERDLLRTTEARAEAGVNSRRVSDTRLREEDLRIQDMSLRGQLQDLDFTEASIRYATLQQQLQAGLTAASQNGSLTLLDFLR